MIAVSTTNACSSAAGSPAGRSATSSRWPRRASPALRERLGMDLAELRAAALLTLSRRWVRRASSWPVSLSERPARSRWSKEMAASRRGARSGTTTLQRHRPGHRDGRASMKGPAQGRRPGRPGRCSPPRRCAPSSRPHLHVSDRFRGSAHRKSDGSCPTSGRSAQRSPVGTSTGFHAVSLRASASHLSGRGIPHRRPPLVTFPVTQKALSLPERALTCGN
jgi:hypothetical protein